MVLLLGLVVGAALYLVEILDLAKRKRWQGTAPPADYPHGWGVASVGAMSLLATMGATLLWEARPLTVDRVDLLVVAQLALAAISLSWATDRARATAETGRWCAVGCAALGIGSFYSFAECVAVLAAGAAASLFLAVIDELRTHHARIQARQRLFGYSCNKQAASCLLLVSCVFYLHLDNRLPLLSVVVVTAGAAPLLWLTRSRTTAYASLAGGLTWAFAASPDHVRATAAIAMTATVVTILAMLAVASTRPLVWHLLLLGRSGSDWRNMSRRTCIWHYLWSHIRRRPLLGYGFGSFWTDRRRSQLLERMRTSLPVLYAHSIYLEVLLNGGCIGLALFLMTLGVAANDAIALGGSMAPFLAAFLVFVIVHGIAESMFVIPPYYCSFALLLLLVGFR